MRGTWTRTQTRAGSVLVRRRRCRTLPSGPRGTEPPRIREDPHPVNSVRPADSRSGRESSAGTGWPVGPHDRKGRGPPPEEAAGPAHHLWFHQTKPVTTAPCGCGRQAMDQSMAAGAGQGSQYTVPPHWDVLMRRRTPQGGHRTAPGAAQGRSTRVPGQSGSFEAVAAVPAEHRHRSRLSPRGDTAHRPPEVLRESCRLLVSGA